MVWIDRIAQRFAVPGETRGSRWTRRAIASAAVAYVAAILVCKLTARESYSWWIREDGPFETATSVVYLVAGVLALHLAGEFHRAGDRIVAALYLVMSLGFLFVAGEEISWGQRILGVQTPEFMREHNLQKETNLHNLATPSVLHLAYILVSGYCGLASFLIPETLRERHPDLTARFVPGRFLAPCFLMALLIYLYLEYGSPLAVARLGPEFGWGKRRFMLAKDQEPAELLMAIGFLSFMVVNCVRQARLLPAARALGRAPRRLLAHPR